MTSVVRIAIAVLALTFAATPIPWASAEGVSFCNTHPVVTPGIGVGSLVLGAPLENDLRVLGDPTDKGWASDAATAFLANRQPTNTTDHPIGWTFINYNAGPNKGFGLIARNNLVVKIDLISGSGTSLEGCATSSGIHVSASPELVTTTFGPPTRIAQLRGKPGATIADVYGAIWAYDTIGFNVNASHASAASNPSILTMSLYLPGQLCLISTLPPTKYNPPCS